LIDTDLLIEVAAEQVGVEDLGDFDPTGLRVLAESLADEESERVQEIASRHILELLCRRLEVERWHLDEPSIGEEAIHAPVFITGIARTGTSALLQRLAQDPETRTIRAWESACPTPPPNFFSKGTDPRIGETQMALDSVFEQSPGISLKAFFSATDSVDCEDFMEMSFLTPKFLTHYSCSGYIDWLVAQEPEDIEPAFRFHKRVLQLLQWRCGPKRWLLKSPFHLGRLDALSRVYEGASFIWTHRDPAAAVASAASLATDFRSLANPAVDPIEIGAEQLALWFILLNSAHRYRCPWNERRGFTDVYFLDQLAHPMGVVADVYARQGWELTDHARVLMKEWTLGNPYVANRHEPRLADYGLHAQAIREAFDGYITDFLVEDEA